MCLCASSTISIILNNYHHHHHHHYLRRRQSREKGVQWRLSFCDVCVCVCLSVRTMKPKPAETKITKIGTSPSQYLSHQLILGQKVKGQGKSQGHKVQKGDRVAGVSYALYRVPILYSVLYYTLIFSAVFNKEKYNAMLYSAKPILCKVDPFFLYHFQFCC